MVCSDSRALLGCFDALGEYFFIILIKLEAIAEYPRQFETMGAIAIQYDASIFQIRVLKIAKNGTFISYPHPSMEGHDLGHSRFLLLAPLILGS